MAWNFTMTYSEEIQKLITGWRLQKTQICGGETTCTMQPMDQRKKLVENQKLPWHKWIWKHNFPKFMGCNKSLLRENFSYTGLSPETGIISNRQYNFIPKGTR